MLDYGTIKNAAKIHKQTLNDFFIKAALAVAEQKTEPVLQKEKTNKFASDKQEIEVNQVKID